MFSTQIVRPPRLLYSVLLVVFSQQAYLQSGIQVVALFLDLLSLWTTVTNYKGIQIFRSWKCSSLVMESIYFKAMAGHLAAFFILNRIFCNTCKISGLKIQHNSSLHISVQSSVAMIRIWLVLLSSMESIDLFVVKLYVGGTFSVTYQ